MWILLFLPLLALAQTATIDRAILEAEQSREGGWKVLAAAGSNPEALRAIGRMENVAHADLVIPHLQSSDRAVRRAAAGAMAQMRAGFAYESLLEKERDPSIRAAIYEAVGRAKPPSANAEALLTKGLQEVGGARGLEALFRLNPPRKPIAATIAALHQAFNAISSEETRHLILLTMNAAGDRDSATLASALKDPSPQVRRLAVMGAKTWVNDASPMVRYQALRAAPTCERAAAAVSDSSDHVALAGVDLLGTLQCDSSLLTPLVDLRRAWRIRAHALVSLANVDPAKARIAIAGMIADKTWQVRVYVANAARKLNATDVLASLAKDPEPNVAIAALTSLQDAMRALQSDHSGLILAGAAKLKGASDLNNRLPRLIEAFQRLTSSGKITVRDPRVALLTRIGEVTTGGEGILEQALSDRDPAVAALAAKILSKRKGIAVAPRTTQLPVPMLPTAGYLAGLVGAKAQISMKGLGTITVDLLTEDAPVTVAVFAQLAEAGKYNGLTFHRIVPNFVIQGGSPGADEYDARSRNFLRDELGFARNQRGTIGVSTRGRDTGDAQIYFNLVDNFRLDRDYTVMARTRDGLDVMDRVQEGDVIERIEILRRR